MNESYHIQEVRSLQARMSDDLMPMQARDGFDMQLMIEASSHSDRCTHNHLHPQHINTYALTQIYTCTRTPEQKMGWFVRMK